MEKNWFVIEKSHYFGPYSWTELNELYQGDKIQPQTQVHNRLKKRTFQAGDLLIQLQKKQRELTSLKPTNKNLSALNSASPANLSTSSLKPDSGIADSVISQKISQLKNIQGLRLYFMRLALLGVLFCVVPLYFFIQDQYLTINKPLGMVQQDFSSFQRLLYGQSQLSNGLGHWRVLQSKDHKSFWLATNIPGTIHGKMKVESLPHQVLTDNKIKRIIPFSIEKFMGQVSVANIIDQGNLPPGIYKLTLEVAQQKQSLFHLIFAPQKELNRFYETKTLLGAKDFQAFQVSLKKFLDAKKKVAAAISFRDNFIQDLQMQQDTLSMIANRLLDFFSEIPSYKNEKDLSAYISHIKDEYQKQYGSLLTFFKLENEKKLEQVKKDNSDLYQELLPLVKDVDNFSILIGQTAVDVFAFYNKYRKDPAQLRKKLRQLQYQ